MMMMLVIYFLPLSILTMKRKSRKTATRQGKDQEISQNHKK